MREQIHNGIFFKKKKKIMTGGWDARKKEFADVYLINGTGKG